ncbi:YceG family protein [Butyrivibrio sp. VCB2001]|uniref:YceG family protein n=1 Tax=Butyrivibrio sp. VCB2001 TaxID=1280667 RepID=UPI0003FBAF94|nr:YceG family protein [Butyrivibrio sp. VCB2001]
MIKHVKAKTIDDFFVGLNDRPERGVYFYRINGYNEEMDRFIHKYFMAAQKNGIIIEGKIQNPDDKSLAYYTETMGRDFQMSPAFISPALKKWMPRLSDIQAGTIAEAIFECLNELRFQGKNDNILKNAFIKFMCWLYYKFEGVVSKIGNAAVPKVLYEGDVSNYELMFFSILSKAGCDVLLLQYNGDSNYLKIDPDSVYSDVILGNGLTKFPENYSLKRVREEVLEQGRIDRLYGEAPAFHNCTNTWISNENVFEAALISPSGRGNDGACFYNIFSVVYGAGDGCTYLNELYNLYKGLKDSGRAVTVVEDGIPVPTIDEIAKVQRKSSYTRQEDLLQDLVQNIRFAQSAELQRIVTKAFLDIMIMESGMENMNLNKLLGKGVYLICWINRYIFSLFSNWKMPNINSFLYLGGCTKENEALFLRMLSRLPLDTIIFVPNLNDECIVEDPALLEIKKPVSMEVKRFPVDTTLFQVGTSAYQAERELDVLMYRDSGMYRNQQYGKANAIILRTMYEEIPLLWNEEEKYRQGFAVNDDVVDIPVIFAKVSGVKNADINKYWSSIKELTGDDVFLIQNVPFIEHNAPNLLKSVATEFLRNGKLQKEKIKNYKNYPYGFLREEMQEHLLNKLQLLIDRKILKGTGENGTEYTTVATVLNLDKELLRIIHKFDFTKKNPKLIYINVGETVISLEDSILIAFLSMVGFDVLMFVPTGYQTVEKFFNVKMFEEHQIGEYLYDLSVPDIESAQHKNGTFWINRIFKKG